MSGGTRLDALLERARDLGYDTLALTDVNALYGMIPFHRKAIEHGITPIIGAILMRHETGAFGGEGDGPAERIVALIRDRQGYQNLCRILSRIHLGGGDAASPRSSPLLQELLIDRHEGLHLLTGDPVMARRLLEIGVPPSRIGLEVVRPGTSIDSQRALVAAGRELGLDLVASGDVHFASPADFETFRVLSVIRRNALLTDAIEELDPLRDRYLRAPVEMERLFADLPGSLAATREIAGACRFDPHPRELIFPSYEVPPGETAVSLLYEACHQGLKHRYRPIPPRALSRLGRELEVIDRLGFSEYFLVVRDIVQESRQRGVPIAGRGSGASSLVAYVLGITNVCPLKFHLAFERFLNERRTSPPDLDIDFCWRIRDEIIDSVFEMFGRDRVAMVCTYITLQARSAFREAAKVHGLSEEQVTRLRALLPGDFDQTWTEARPFVPRRGFPVDPRTFERIMADARRILGFPQHLSVHPGGVVLGRLPIDHYTPLERAEKGVIISQFDKDAIEEVGLVKIDLLGNRALSTIRETLDGVRCTGGGSIDIEALPDEDPATLDLLARGDTVGCNQLESPAMRSLLRQVAPRSIREVMIALALIRPGAASLGMKEEFIRRHRRLVPWQVPHPALDEFLGETYGIMVYEDDAMLVAAALTGMSLEDGDRFRKAVQKCGSDQQRLRLSRDFLGRCRENRMPDHVARDLWVQMAKFNSYSFCKSHAASYALLAYATAYLKSHHPLAFWVAALNNNQGLYDKRVYVEEAKRGGIEVLLPCVDRSGREFSIDGEAIRVGLDRIRGLESRAIAGLIEGRADGPYRSLADLLSRVKLKREDARALILAGALDGTGRPRPRLILELETRFEELQSRLGTPRLFDASEPGSASGAPSGEPALPDFTGREKYRMELELLELSTREHLLAPLRSGLPAAGTITSRDLPSRCGEDVSLFGILDACRRTTARDGDSMEFLTLEDEYGIFECTLFPTVYRRYSRQIRSIGPYRVWGRVENHHDSITLALTRLEQLERLEWADGEPAAGPDR